MKQDTNRHEKLENTHEKIRFRNGVSWIFSCFPFILNCCVLLLQDGHDFSWSMDHTDGTYLYLDDEFDKDLRAFVNSGFTEAQWDHATGLTGYHGWLLLLCVVVQVFHVIHVHISRLQDVFWIINDIWIIILWVRRWDYYTVFLKMQVQ